MNETQTLRLEIGLCSETGPSRKLNEDTADYRLPDGEAQQRARGALFVVADGMGGYSAGEEASRAAAQTVMDEYYAHATPDPAAALRQAIGAANEQVHRQAASDQARSGMGTTLVAAAIISSRVIVANVGDSRAYRITPDSITQITHDHSWVEEQIEAGVLTREQARHHPQRSLITRALGRRPAVEADLFEGTLQPGEALLLCTDGVSGPLSAAQMAQTVRSLPPQRAAARLVAQAIAAGGTDNASALIVQAAAAAARPQARARQVDRITAPGLTSRPWLIGGVAAVLVLCLLAAAIFLPALTQKLAGDPVAAPLPAPLQDGRLAGSTADQVALYLGYTGAAQMSAAHEGAAQGGALASESLGASDLWPAARGLFLVGVAREWGCQQQICRFRLEMARAGYEVTYQTPGEQGVELSGRPVRVYGTQPKGQAAVAAQLIQRGSQWWAWWQPAWTVVHQTGAWEQSVWVYSTVDRNPNGLVGPDEVPGLQPGAQLLLRGRWRVDARSISFEREQTYTLQGAKYLPLKEQAGPPLPTVTLQPTREAFLDHRSSNESAGSGD